MKKIVLGLLFVSSSAMAHGPYGTYGQHNYHYGHHRHNSYNWVAPTIIGGVIGYEIARLRPMPPVIVQPAPVIIQSPYTLPTIPNCTAWTETQDQYGNITRTRVCNP